MMKLRMMRNKWLKSIKKQLKSVKIKTIKVKQLNI